MNRKLSQDDNVLNRFPLLKYSWVEIYSLIFHYHPSPGFAYLRCLELVLGTISPCEQQVLGQLWHQNKCVTLVSQFIIFPDSFGQINLADNTSCCSSSFQYDFLKYWSLEHNLCNRFSEHWLTPFQKTALHYGWIWAVSFWKSDFRGWLWCLLGSDMLTHGPLQDKNKNKLNVVNVPSLNEPKNRSYHSILKFCSLNSTVQFLLEHSYNFNIIALP